MELDGGGLNDAKADSWVGRKQRLSFTHRLRGLAFVPEEFSGVVDWSEIDLLLLAVLLTTYSCFSFLSVLPFRDCL